MCLGKRLHYIIKKENKKLDLDREKLKKNALQNVLPKKKCFFIYL